MPNGCLWQVQKIHGFRWFGEWKVKERDMKMEKWRKKNFPKKSENQFSTHPHTHTKPPLERHMPSLDLFSSRKSSALKMFINSIQTCCKCFSSFFLPKSEMMQLTNLNMATNSQAFELCFATKWENKKKHDRHSSADSKLQMAAQITSANGLLS